MIVPPAWEEACAREGDMSVYTVFRSCGWPPRPTSCGGFLSYFPRDMSFCRKGCRVWHGRADRFQGSAFPVGIVRHGQCQQSVTNHGIRLTKHFSQLLAARNTDGPGNAEALIDRQAGEVADE